MTVTGDQLYVAKETFWAEVDGVPTCVPRGQHVHEGHRFLALRPDAFETADRHVALGMEQATAAPGEKRGRGGRGRITDQTETRSM